MKEGSSSGAPSALRLYTLISLMTALWAANFVISKIALREMPAVLTAGLRTTLAGLFILPIYVVSHRNGSQSAWSRRDIPILIFLGVFGVALNQLFFVLGIGRTSVAHAAIVIGLTPVMVLLIAAAMGQERLQAVKLIGMLIALGGVLVLQMTAGNGSGATLLGDLYIFLAALAFAVFTVSGKRVSSKFGSVTVNTFAYVGGGLMLLPVTIWDGAGFDFAAVSSAAWMSLIYMAVFPSVVCYLIYYYALMHIPASRVSAFSYLQPLLATLLAIPVLGERLNASLVVGGALVLLGVYLTERD